MPTPRNIDYKAIFRRVNDQLIADHKDATTPPPQLADTTKADVREHMAKTIQYVEGIPGLNHNYQKLSDNDVAEVAFKYALALVKGKSVDSDGERLDDGYLTRQLTTVPPPVAREEETPDTRKAPSPPPKPLGHLLESERNMNIFHGEVARAAKRPGPEQAFARMLEIQMKTREGRADVLRLFKAMDVMTTMESTNKVSDYATNGNAVNEMWQIMSPAQRGLMLDIVLEDDRWRINPKRWLNPQSPGGMTRRAALGGIGAGILGWLAWATHADAHKSSDDAIGVGEHKAKTPPSAPQPKTRPGNDKKAAPPKGKDEDFFGEDQRGAEKKQRQPQPGDVDFFGNDPREVAAKPEVQVKLKDAVQQDRIALGEAIGAAVLGGFGTYHLIRRITVQYLPSTADKIGAAISGGDGPMYRAKEKIRQADTDEGRGPTT